MEWYHWIGIGFAIFGAIKGGVANGLAKGISKASIETGELLTVFGLAIEDGGVTSEEAWLILDEAADARDAVIEVCELLFNRFQEGK